MQKILFVICCLFFTKQSIYLKEFSHHFFIPRYQFKAVLNYVFNFIKCTLSLYQLTDFCANSFFIYIFLSSISYLKSNANLQFLTLQI